MRQLSIVVAAALSAAAPALAQAAQRDPWQRPAWRVTGGIPLTWRSASAHPESGLGLQFRTDTPYAGLDLEGQLFPRRAFPSLALPPWAEPLGLSVSLSHRALTSRLGAEEFGSREQRAALDVLYEKHLPARSTRLTGRAGWAWHRFGVDESAVIGTVTHQGPRLGIDLVQPLHPRVDAIGGVSVMPWAIIGGEEKRARGEASEGWGSELLLGLGGRVPQVRGLGWRVVYDYLRFSDRYAGTGVLSAGGTGAAAHHAILLGATWQR